MAVITPVNRGAFPSDNSAETIYNAMGSVNDNDDALNVEVIQATADVATNAGAIVTADAAITINAGNIATNVIDIAANAAAIALNPPTTYAVTRNTNILDIQTLDTPLASVSEVSAVAHKPYELKISIVSTLAEAGRAFWFRYRIDGGAWFILDRQAVSTTTKDIMSLFISHTPLTNSIILEVEGRKDVTVAQFDVWDINVSIVQMRA